MSKVNAKDMVAMGIYHFHPRWTVHTGDSMEKRIEEFETVMKAGYFNSIIVEVEYLNNDEFWRVIFENDAAVWLNIYDFFVSEKEDYDTWFKDFVEPLNILKSNPERWDRFQGFHFDEPVWRGQKNKDFLEMTKNLYETYNKRIYPVFATGEFTQSEGNEQQLNLSGDKMRKVVSSSLKYVTDVGFDSYSVDVREGASNNGIIERSHAEFPEIVDGASYYKVLCENLKKVVGHDVNIWLYPCAYTTSLWGGLNGQGRADEEYCLTHLEFFRELLLSQDFKGGIDLYTYKNSEAKPVEQGLVSFLDIKNENGEQYLFPEIPKWERYSKRLREICEEFRNTNANHSKYKA